MESFVDWATDGHSILHLEKRVVLLLGAQLTWLKFQQTVKEEQIEKSAGLVIEPLIGLECIHSTGVFQAHSNNFRKFTENAIIMAELPECTRDDGFVSCEYEEYP